MAREKTSISMARSWKLNKAEIKRKFDEIVASSDKVGKLIDTPVKYYSSGMYIRLAFAVAAHLEPDIFCSMKCWR